ncbi:unnamed protein product [Chrysodeixis includens]|uniref:FLYWCH-type domain-containing protein n=1 Tax=Chrysodeixis includens TaxID=689277 RepID=A0A9P0BMW8_CHRIL|nr:unnamed protein product [Chrysodeixis includens]
MIQLRNNKKLLMIDGFTYHKNGAKRRNGVRWCCSSKMRGCPAAIVLNEELGTILLAGGKHDHEPPKYYKENQYYIKYDEAPRRSKFDSDTSL